MIKVYKYIDTNGTEEYKKFINQPFSIDMLYPIFNDKSVDTLFDDWIGKNMISWYRFTNSNKIVLEFYSDKYIVKLIGNTIGYQLTLPKTIDDFINDLSRFGIQLYWTEWIDINFEPKHYLPKDEIRLYYVNLLSKMGKSNELI